MRLYALISNRCGMMMLISFLAHTLLNMVIEAEYAQWGQIYYNIESLIICNNFNLFIDQLIR